MFFMGSVECGSLEKFQRLNRINMSLRPPSKNYIDYIHSPKINIDYIHLIFCLHLTTCHIRFFVLDGNKCQIPNSHKKKLKSK